MDISCLDSTHTAFAVYAGLCVVIYPVGIPALYFTLLFQRRRQLNPVASISREETTEPRMRLMTEKEVIKQRDENPSNSKILFLVEPYRPTYYYWEVVEAARRLALTSALSILQSGSLVQRFLGLWLCIFMVMAYIEFKPHIRFQEFMLSLVTQLQIFLVFMASILSGCSGDVTDSTGLSVLLITTTVIVLILGVGLMCGEALIWMLERLGAHQEDQATVTERLTSTIQQLSSRSPSKAIELADHRTREEWKESSTDHQPVIVDNPLHADATTSEEALGNSHS